jgi:hypothetical protein
MGAIARQVLQVKRKNSTNWSSPEARLTVVGSVAWSSGPREVTIGNGVGPAASVDTAAKEGVSVESAARIVGLDPAAGWLGETAPLAGEQAASKTARLDRRLIEGISLEERRIFIIYLLVYMSY